MTAQILSRELENIIQESKKKHADIKNAADRSLKELKGLPLTSDAQISADLRQRPEFSNPILSACKSNNAKIALSGIICLQRLVGSGSLATEKLQELLEVFLECSSKSNHDIQLRILQSLPSLLQNYADDLESELQASIFQVCSKLQQAKSAAVSSTSAATLQQVISSVFEKVEREDGKAESIPASAKLDLDGESLAVRPAAHDAFRVLTDLCLLTEGQPAVFMTGAIFQQSFGLELIETIMSNQGEIFGTHKELGFLLRNRILPLVTHFLADRLSFPLTVRTTRLLCIILREHLNIIRTECDIPLGLLNHLLESDASSMNWRRALCMETFRLIYCTPNLITEIYRLFDQNPDKRNIVQENLAHFVRLASEKPALIGVGPQSSYPAGPTTARTTSHDQAVIEAGTVAGIISGDLGVVETNATGISTQWSTLKAPCLDVLDKSEPPAIPETYVYSLVLTCLNGLSEGLARAVLPLTAQSRTKPDPTQAETADGTEDPEVRNTFKGDIPALDELSQPHEVNRSKSPQLNPLPREKVDKNPVAETVSHMTNECWPAILATSSTFLFAALDADFYRGLIRSVQKFTQVAGLLRLATPRDAFFTTLSKSAIPANLAKTDGLMSPGSAVSPRIASTDSFFPDGTSAKIHARRNSVDSAPASLSQRNLMCLRALINLAIALGSTLDNSWSIIIESLQKADSILAQSGTATSREFRSNAINNERLNSDQNSKQSALNAEISAVEAAIARLLQSTVDFPNESFLHVLQAFCDLTGEKDPSTPAGSSGSGSMRLLRRTTTSTFPNTPAYQTRSVHFAISKLGELARINIGRLAADRDSAAWTFLGDRLREIATSPSAENAARLMAADIIGSIALGITIEAVDEEADTRQEVQLRALASLEREVKALYENLEIKREAPSNTDIDVHRAAIEALRAILEKCGESLVAGWRSIFTIVRSIFAVSKFIQDDNDADDNEEEEEEESGSADDDNEATQEIPSVISPKTARSAFACVQLVCSDFLQSLKQTRFIILIDLLCQFCGQKADLNISLTTITLFWNLSDFLGTEASLAIHDRKLFSSKNSLPNESVLRDAAEEGSLPAIWLILQRRLALMTSDGRLEVRNGAVQTVFRTLGSSAEGLSPQLWTYSFRKVIIEMLRINISSHQRYLNSSQGSSLRAETRLESTTDVILKGLASTFVSHLQTIAKLPTLDSIWTELVEQFPPLFSLGSNEVYASVFDFLSQILAVVGSDGFLGSKTIRQTLTMLQNNLPKSRNPSDSTGTEKALVAFVGSLKQIYALMQADIGSDQIIVMVENLHDCILNSTAQLYSSDLDNCTALQTVVLDSFQVLRTDLQGVPSAILEHLSPLLELPYEVADDQSKFGGLTFVTFSKGVMDIAQRLVIAHSNAEEIYDSGALQKVLKALCVAISFKYRHRRQGREPFMWQKATSSALQLLPKILPKIESFSGDSKLKSELLVTLGELKNHITSADVNGFSEDNDIFSEESFDLKASDDLRKCLGIRQNLQEDVTNAMLASMTLREGAEMRRIYVKALFNNSLLHESDVLITSSPLTGLYDIRAGRTYDPPFRRRIRMCYDCLDELFALTAVGLNGSNKTTKSPENGISGHEMGFHSTETNEISRNDTEAALPNAVFEHVVLRCALPLKRYIADQPLRGKMPTPSSQRLELLYVLQKMRDLDCVVGVDMREYQKGDSKGLPFRIPMLKPWKRHLEWLLPLVHMASTHARRDTEIADALQRVIDVAISHKDS